MEKAVLVGGKRHGASEQDHSYRPVREDNAFRNNSGHEAQVLASGCAYWYFKTIAFGSTDPNDHPKLASLCMEIAATFRGAFLAANIVGGLMRANMDTQFWRRLLRLWRDFISKHLLMFGEHPTELMLRDQPVYVCRMARTQQTVMVCKVYQDRSFQHAVVGCARVSFAPWHGDQTYLPATPTWRIVHHRRADVQWSAGSALRGRV
jgi:hypothetical protein